MGESKRRRHGGKNTYRGRQTEEHRRDLKDTVGHGKSKHKTQDTIKGHRTMTHVCISSTLHTATIVYGSRMWTGHLISHLNVTVCLAYFVFFQTVRR